MLCTSERRTLFSMRGNTRHPDQALQSAIERIFLGVVLRHKPSKFPLASLELFQWQSITLVRFTKKKEKTSNILEGSLTLYMTSIDDADEGTKDEQLRVLSHCLSALKLYMQSQDDAQH